VAERVSKSVYIALGCTRSPTFRKHLRQRRELCAGPLACSLQSASNLHANMGWSMGENVRRKVGICWRQWGSNMATDVYQALPQRGRMLTRLPQIPQKL
jgi:hypothetical protein